MHYLVITDKDRSDLLYQYVRYLRAYYWKVTIARIKKIRKELGYGGKDDKALNGLINWRGDGVLSVEYVVNNYGIRKVIGKISNITYEDGTMTIEMELDRKIKDYKNLDSVYFCINYQLGNKLNEFTNGLVIWPKRVCPKYQ